MPYSCALNTPVSNFEVQQNYKEVADPAVVCAFPLVDEPETKLLAWTTTPWTLPSNLALCVHPEKEYVKLKDEASGDVYVMMAARMAQVYPGIDDPKKKKEVAKKFTALGRFVGGRARDAHAGGRATPSARTRANPVVGVHRLYAPGGSPGLLLGLPHQCQLPWARLACWRQGSREAGLRLAAGTAEARRGDRECVVHDHFW